MPSMTPKMTSASGGKVNLQFKDRGYKYVQTYYAGVFDPTWRNPKCKNLKNFGLGA